MNQLKWVLVGFVFIILLFITRLMAAQSDKADLLVYADLDMGAISPFVYGANYGPPYLVPPDLVPLAAESGVTYFRTPAGRWGDEQDFRTDLLDIYYRQAHDWGVELAVTVRLPGSGGTPEKAADLVRYTHDKGYNIRYWAIGNEPDLIAGYKKTDQALTSFTDVRIDDYNRDWRLVAEAMLAVNPDIIFVGPDVSQFPYTVTGDPYTNVRREWVRAFLTANGDLVDIVSVHRYPFPLTTTSSTTIDDLRTNPPEWNIVVENLRTVVQDTVGHEMPLAITEANSHWSHSVGGEATPDSVFNAIWWADVLGRLIQQRLTIVSYFSFQSVSASGPFGILARYEERPTYYVYQMYKRFGTELVESQSNDADVSITAARTNDGTLTLMVVNRAASDKELSIEINGFTVDREAEVWRFDSDHLAESIPAVDIRNGLSVPAQSITLYRLIEGS